MALISLQDVSIGFGGPRDLYVEIPCIERRQGVIHGKLNQALLYSNPGYAYQKDPNLPCGGTARQKQCQYDLHELME